MRKRVVLLVVLCLSVMAPVQAGANHEVEEAVATAQGAVNQTGTVLSNNMPFPVGGLLDVDATGGTWTVRCHAGAPVCPMSASGVLETETHVGPVDTAACPAWRGTGAGAIDPVLGLFGGPYAAAELHDLRITVTPAAALLEGAWRDASGRGDRFAAVLATPPLPVPSAGCHTAGLRTAGFTGWAWAAGVR